MCRDNAGCAIRNREAALDTVPSSATVTNVRAWRSFMPLFMPDRSKEQEEQSIGR
jgi:hypothetical protein